jgi:hypothetical protein
MRQNSSRNLFEGGGGIETAGGIRDIPPYAFFSIGLSYNTKGLHQYWPESDWKENRKKLTTGAATVAVSADRGEKNYSVWEGQKLGNGETVLAFLGLTVNESQNY